MAHQYWNARPASPVPDAEGENVWRYALLSLFNKGSVGCEIGVWKGRFTRTVLGVVHPSKLYLIDPYKSQQGVETGEYSSQNAQVEMDRIFAETSSKIYKSAAPQGTRVEFIRKFSSDADADVPDGELDWMYIDGDHSYEGCSGDLQLALKKVRRGGWIICDDYRPSCGVVKAVHDACQANPAGLRFWGAVFDQAVLMHL